MKSRPVRSSQYRGTTARALRQGETTTPAPMKSSLNLVPTQKQGDQSEASSIKVVHRIVLNAQSSSMKGESLYPLLRSGIDPEAKSGSVEMVHVHKVDCACILCMKDIASSVDRLTQDEIVSMLSQGDVSNKTDEPILLHVERAMEEDGFLGISISGDPLSKIWAAPVALLPEIIFTGWSQSGVVTHYEKRDSKEMKAPTHRKRGFPLRSV